MAQMDYFRRPLLVGRNLRHNTRAVVRGSLRRSDADVDSSVPYFPGVSAGNTLIINTDTGSVTAVLPGSGYNDILDAINTALGVKGIAMDGDGVITLQTATAGGLGFIEVTGGTAAALVGFDTSAGVRLRSVGGDIPSSPEGRNSNWFGVACPGFGENFGIETISRMMGRLSTNLDVIYSEHLRGDALLQRVGALASSTPIVGHLNHGYFSPGASVQVFTGLTLLTKDSSREELSSYFLILDTVTKLPAASQVVGVCKGAPTHVPGDGEYVNTASWSANDGGNVLGQDLVKVSNRAITSIKSGRVVFCSGMNFVTSGVVVGDLASISSATNLTPWDNNGYKWVVEEIVANDTIALRPMSKSELALVVTSPIDEQPVVALNGEKTGGENYGNVSIKTGSFCTQVNLIVSPAIPTGASYELWVAQPKGLRASKPYDFQRSFVGAHRESVNTLDAFPNGILSGCVATGTDIQISITAGYLRWHGKPVYAPATTILDTTLPVGTTFYVYWDLTVGAYVVTTTGTDVVGTGAKGPMVASGIWTGAALTLRPGTRLLAEGTRTITVGIGGDFADLDKAINYVNSASEAAVDGAWGNSTYAHFEILLVSDVTLSATAVVTAPSLVIRGVNPTVRITFSGTSEIQYNNVGVFELRDVAVAASSFVNRPIISYTCTTSDYNCQVKLTNVRGILGAFTAAVRSTASRAPGLVVIDGCELSLAKNIVVVGSSGADACYRIILKDSKFWYSNQSLTDQVMVAAQDGSAWLGETLHVSGCEFVTWTKNNPGYLLVYSDGLGSVVVAENKFVFGTALSANSSVALVFGGSSSKVKFTDNTVEGWLPKTILAPLGIASGNYIESNTSNTSNMVVDVAVAANNHLVHVGTANGGYAIKARVATSNIVEGSFTGGVQFSEIADSNSVTLHLAATGYVSCGIRAITHDYERLICSDNSVSVTLKDGATCYGVFVGSGADTPQTLSISGNTVLLLDDDSGDGTISGIHVACTSVGVANINDNVVYGSGLTSGATVYGLYTTVPAGISNNRTSLGADLGTGIYLGTGALADSKLDNNVFSCYIAIDTPGGHFTGVATSNTFIGRVKNLAGRVVGNYINMSSGACTGSSGYWSNNRVVSLDDVITFSDEHGCTIKDNVFEIDSGASFTIDISNATVSPEISGNYVTGKMVINQTSTSSIRVNGNFVVGNYDINASAGAEGQILFDYNRCTVDLLCTRNGVGTKHTLTISNCVVGRHLSVETDSTSVYNLTFINEVEVLGNISTVTSVVLNISNILVHGNTLIDTATNASINGSAFVGAFSSTQGEPGDDHVQDLRIANSQFGSTASFGVIAHLSMSECRVGLAATMNSEQSTANPYVSISSCRFDHLVTIESNDASYVFIGDSYFGNGLHVPSNVGHLIVSSNYVWSSSNYFDLNAWLDLTVNDNIIDVRRFSLYCVGDLSVDNNKVITSSSDCLSIGIAGSSPQRSRIVGNKFTYNAGVLPVSGYAFRIAGGTAIQDLTVTDNHFFFNGWGSDTPNPLPDAVQIGFGSGGAESIYHFVFSNNVIVYNEGSNTPAPSESRWGNAVHIACIIITGAFNGNLISKPTDRNFGGVNLFYRYWEMDKDPCRNLVWSGNIMVRRSGGFEYASCTDDAGRGAVKYVEENLVPIYFSDDGS